MSGLGADDYEWFRRALGFPAPDPWADLAAAMERHYAPRERPQRDPLAIIAEGKRIMADLEERRVSRGHWSHDGSPVSAAFKRATFAAWEAARDEHRRQSAPLGRQVYASAGPSESSEFIKSMYGV